MAATNSPMPGTPGHQRSKSAFRTFMKHRRNNSDGTVLTSSALGASTLDLSASPRKGGAGPLGETSHNRQQEPSLSSLNGKRDMSNNNNSHKPESSSPTKKKKLTTEPLVKQQTTVDRPDRSVSPTKKAANRSTTNLVGLLSRPKSLRNMHKLVVETEQKPERGRERERGNKENQAPNSAIAAKENTPPQQTPIYAQFNTDGKGSNSSGNSAAADAGAGPNVSANMPGLASKSAKARPKSFHPSSSTAFNSPSTQASPTEPAIDPKDIATHLEALLDRRNIPENQRYKMRSLADTIKMEFIRQDWAEQRAKRSASDDSTRSTTNTASAAVNTPLVPCPTMTASSSAAVGVPQDSPRKAPKSKHSRVKSLTFSRTRGRSSERDGASSQLKNPISPRKKKTEGTLGRHLRSKSTESMVSLSGGDAASSTDSSATGNAGNGNAIVGFFNKAKGPQQHSPLDFVTYLRTVQKPELVEVGKLHKLRLLLRNETVAWIEDFIGQGGMEEIVSLLHRILAIEWREEHEDALLHENLLCLKALCTTGMALQYLNTIHDTLFPALIHMIFDPEKKGPSEFTTRNIVTSVLLTYIQSAPTSERPSRAITILGYLRDPEGKEEEKPVSFVLDMRRERPYRVWCKEVVSVTKEVFWIFLHHLNVIALPKDNKLAQTIGKDISTALAMEYSTAASSTSQQPPSPPAHMDQSVSYMLRHFPKERPPVPAAPYVGGVEWDATNYLASHLDLVNAILACTPTAAERNKLRGLMEISGWERCMGGTLRLCKEKFYGAVHDALRTWVAAAHEDGWDARSVRYGPPPPSSSQSPERSSPKKKTQAGGSPKEPAPKIEIPKIDFAFDGGDL